MSPAARPPDLRDRVRLMLVDGRDGDVQDEPAVHLHRLLEPGDLLVLNDAATLPASLREPHRDLEVRLTGCPAGDRWRTVLFGAGDWRTPTEDRPPPPRLPEGARLRFADELCATVVEVSRLSPRLVWIRFDQPPDQVLSALYRMGRPVQYSHLASDAPLSAFQTVYHRRPWAAEMPSAGRPLTVSTVVALRRRGVALATLTHAAGLSATGDPALDQALPLPERYEIPAETIAAIARASALGKRVLAVGTTVVRALEGCVHTHRSLVPGEGETDLVIRPGFRPRVVDGILTGLHAEGESHFSILLAFCAKAHLRRAWDMALRLGYRAHEFGDLMLVLTPRGARLPLAHPRIGHPRGLLPTDAAGRALIHPEVEGAVFFP